MQAASWNFLGLIGGLLILAGMILIVVGLVMRNSAPDNEREIRTESKGVMLLGPIPIVWGFGKTGWIIAAIVAIGLFLALLALAG
jgi:uncharacterized membrane protein